MFAVKPVMEQGTSPLPLDCNPLDTSSEKLEGESCVLPPKANVGDHRCAVNVSFPSVVQVNVIHFQMSCQ